MSFRLILTLLLSLVVAVFIIQNTAVVEIRFLFWTVSMSRALLILVLLAIGVALSWLLQGYLALRRKR
ncbi:MAG: lipopolysaccharide assembly protein LapA domain-containing protein [Gammaproteobacteria bacterium]|nr:lipopolysaccharide assembly protein LapA domain-containing protein [Gammaproteobacteria bacterium]